MASPISRTSWHYRFMRWYYKTSVFTNGFKEPKDICSYRKGLVLSLLGFLPTALAHFLMGMFMVLVSFIGVRPDCGLLKAWMIMFGLASETNGEADLGFDWRYLLSWFVLLAGYPLYDWLNHGLQIGATSEYSRAILWSLAVPLCIITLLIVVAVMMTAGMSVQDHLKYGDSAIADMWRSFKDKVCWKVDYTGDKSTQEDSSV